VLEQMLRIGQQAIVSFPNFAYWRVRWDLLRRGRMPITSDLPVPWYDTANIHLCTILDFWRCATR
jgi:methionine biosynthesis protein MetW